MSSSMASCVPGGSGGIWHPTLLVFVLLVVSLHPRSMGYTGGEGGPAWLLDLIDLRAPACSSIFLMPCVSAAPFFAFNRNSEILAPVGPNRDFYATCQFSTLEEAIRVGWLTFFPFRFRLRACVRVKARARCTPSNFVFFCVVVFWLLVGHFCHGRGERVLGVFVVSSPMSVLNVLAFTLKSMREAQGRGARGDGLKTGGCFALLPVLGT